MKKLYSLVAVAFASVCICAQTFTATYDFSQNPSSSDGGTIVGSNVSTSLFSTVGGVYVATTGNRYANSGASLGSQDPANYMEVTVTPAVSYSLSITSISFRAQRSSTGPRDFAVRSNVDGYSANLPASINPANADLSIISPDVIHFVNDVSGGASGGTITPTNILAINAPVTFRIYPFNAEVSSGTYSVDDFQITGSVASALGVTDIINVKAGFVKNTFVEEEINFGSRADVKIFSMNGQVLKTATVSENKSLNVAELAPGMYIVTGMVNGEAVSQKIMKK